MLYIKSYFKKELQQTYVESHLGNLKKIAYALFLGLFSFAVYFLLQTLAESVLTDIIPHIMQNSYFSTLYLYISMAFSGFVFYFIVNYDAMSFAEIRKNRWYMLIKMGYRPFPMIFSKLLALILSLFYVYTAGFVFTVLLTVFLKFTFIFGYLPSLYLTGLVDLMVISMAFLAVSLLVKSTSLGRYLLVGAAVAQSVLKVLLGYHTVITNRVAMQNFLVLFDFHQSLYLPVVVLIVLICFVICIIRAKTLAQCYSLPYDTYGYTLPEDAKVVKFIGKKRKPVSLDTGDIAARRSKIFSAVTTGALILLIFVSLAFNVFIILMSTAQPGKEAVIGGKVPYIFQSDTMEPTIMENDLAFFDKIDVQQTVDVGDIVLFTDQSTVYVERVIKNDGDVFEVDIDYYPAMAQQDAMIKTVERSNIYGIFSYTNRWLGAMILFANSIFGRLLLLVVPAFLLFFNKSIQAFFQKRRHSAREQ